MSLKPQKPRAAADPDREIADHIERMVAANIAAGMSPEEARRRALIDFGGREQVRQQVREAHLSALAESLRFHLRAALRFLLKSPGFSLAVILTLALGIGANTAVFSAIDDIVLRPLPFPHGDELVRIYQHDAKGRNANTSVAPQRLEPWNRMSTALSGVTGYYKDDLSELSGPLPEKITEALVAPRFLQVLAVAPIGTLSYLGRLRQREVGVRLALGAPRQSILAGFLFQGLRVAALGCAAGLALSVLLSRFLRGMLYGVSTLDPVTYAGVLACCC